MTANDNFSEFKGSKFNRPDAYGQAGLILIESLLHALIESGMLTVNDTIEIVETAIDVQAEISTAAGKATVQDRRARAHLSAIALSLKCDLSDTGSEGVGTRPPFTQSGRSDRTDRTIS